MDEPPRTHFEPSAHVDALARQVIGAAIEVHRRLGPGFLESVYERAMCIELEFRKIPFRSQVMLPLEYRGRSVGDSQLDLLVDEELVVEIKAVANLVEIHRAQVISYLKATGRQLGLLINFNTPVLKSGVKRVVWTPSNLAPWSLGG